MKPPYKPLTEEELEDTAMSFEEWKMAGFMVRAGQKSRLQDACGRPQFTLDQVTALSLRAMISIKGQHVLPDGSNVHQSTYVMTWEQLEELDGDNDEALQEAFEHFQRRLGRRSCR